MLTTTLFESVFNRSPFGHYLLSPTPDATILAVNDAFLKASARTRDELVGVSLFTAFPGDPTDPADLGEASLRNSLAKVRTSSQPDTLPAIRYPIPIVLPNGETIFEERFWTATSTPVFGADGELVCISHSNIDVTDQVKSEAALRESEQRLREADRRKDEFLAMLSHELRNPLAPIGAAAELLQRTTLDESVLARTSQIIGRQVRHMTALIDDLLDVSRVTRGLVELDQTMLDVDAVLYEAVEQVTPLIEARGHSLALNLPPHGTQVLADRKRLVQVIANLLGNAAKYTLEGGRLGVSAFERDGWLCIDVQDNGIGMAPELAARAFERFTQAERASDRSSGGLGLGLALVKSLVELHGGVVACDSAGPGQGSRFSVCLPGLHAPQAAAPALDEQPASTAAPLRVLVVDDNVDAAVILSMLLEANGHQVQVEHDPLEALKTLDRLEAALDAPPQACLLDIGLPGIDGLELARRLRARPGTARALLVAITGYGQDSDRQQILQAGFDHHLVKPIDIAQLYALLDGAG